MSEGSSPLSSLDEEIAEQSEEQLDNEPESVPANEVEEGGSNPTLEQRKAKMEELRKRMVCVSMP